MLNNPFNVPQFTTNTSNTYKMSATTVDVKNISAKTEDKEIRDFFSFW